MFLLYRRVALLVMFQLQAFKTTQFSDQMKFNPPKDVSVPVKQPSHSNKFIEKKNKLKRLK